MVTESGSITSRALVASLSTIGSHVPQGEEMTVSSWAMAAPANNSETSAPTMMVRIAARPLSARIRRQRHSRGRARFHGRRPLDSQILR